jgi:hypothetical protein
MAGKKRGRSSRLRQRPSVTEDPRRVVLAQHDRLLELAMKLVEMIELAQASDQKIDASALRKTTGRILLDSIARRDRALHELGLTVRPALTLVESRAPDFARRHASVTRHSIPASRRH